MNVSIWHWPGLGAHTYVLTDDMIVARRFHDPTVAVLFAASKVTGKGRVVFKNKVKRWYYRDGD